MPSHDCATRRAPGPAAGTCLHEAAVIVPAWNGRATIVSALASAAASIAASERDVVISVRDDASDDDTAALIQGFAADSPVPVVLGRNAARVGPGGSRNRAVDQVPARAYLFLDQDDEYLPGHVEHCLGLLAREPTADYVKTAVRLDAPVHPEWQAGIAQSLVQTLCVRARCHRLAGGFLDHPVIAAYGCDDVLYNRVLSLFFRGLRSSRATVRFHRRPGNSFDRQLAAKFSQAVGEGADTRSPEQRALTPVVLRLFADRVRDTARRVAGGVAVLPARTEGLDAGPLA